MTRKGTISLLKTAEKDLHGARSAYEHGRYSTYLRKLRRAKLCLSSSLLALDTTIKDVFAESPEAES